MRLEIAVKILEGEIITGKEYLKRDIKRGCGSDLMSDVLSFIKFENTLLLTGLANPQVIYSADAVDITAIGFVRGKRPREDVIKLADERKMVLFCTTLPMFESCGRLYKEGLLGSSEHD